MDRLSTPDDSGMPDLSMVAVPDAISHKTLLFALAADYRQDIPKEGNYLFPLLHDLLALHWLVEPPSEEERTSVMELLGH